MCVNKKQRKSIKIKFWQTQWSAKGTECCFHCARLIGYPTVEFLSVLLQLSLLYSLFFYYFCFNYFGFALKASNPLDSSSHSSQCLPPSLSLPLFSFHDFACLFCHSKSFSSAIQCCFLLCLAAREVREREWGRERGCWALLRFRRVKVPLFYSLFNIYMHVVNCIDYLHIKWRICVGECVCWVCACVSVRVLCKIRVWVLSQVAGTQNRLGQSLIPCPPSCNLFPLLLLLPLAISIPVTGSGHSLCPSGFLARTKAQDTQTGQGYKYYAYEYTKWSHNRTKANQTKQNLTKPNRAQAQAEPRPELKHKINRVKLSQMKPNKAKKFAENAVERASTSKQPKTPLLLHVCVCVCLCECECVPRKSRTNKRVIVCTWIHWINICQHITTALIASLRLRLSRLLSRYPLLLLLSPSPSLLPACCSVHLHAADSIAAHCQVKGVLICLPWRHFFFLSLSPSSMQNSFA